MGGVQVIYPDEVAKFAKSSEPPQKKSKPDVESPMSKPQQATTSASKKEVQKEEQEERPVRAGSKRSRD